MKKVSVYARSGAIAPTCYYRVLQYVKGQDVNYAIRGLFSEAFYKWFYSTRKLPKPFSLLKKIYAYIYTFIRIFFFLLWDVLIYKPDIVIVSKVLTPRYTPAVIRALFDRLLTYSFFIWDFDDHLLAEGQISKKMFDYFSEKSDRIIVTHAHLQSTIQEKFYDKIIIMPTTDGDMISLKMHDLNQNREKTYCQQIHIVWVGQGVNLPYLKAILPNMDRAAKIIYNNTGKKTKLTIVCNGAILEKYSSLHIVNIEWTREAAIQVMSEAHIGIMPLIDTPFTRGKGGFKLIQYLGAGIPVLGSSVGFNEEIIQDSCGFLIKENEEWIDKIVWLSTDFLLWKNLSIGARKRYNEDFSYVENQKIWTCLIHETK